MSFKQSNAPRTEHAYQTIRQFILENQFQPGEQIFEKDLVARLGSSRTPVREACVQLEREGLIEIRPRKGIYINPISASDMSEIYDILTALEAQAAAAVATKVADQHLDISALTVLRIPTFNMQQALDADDLIAWAEADEAFHLALLELSDNRRLKEVVLQFWGQAHRARYFTLKLREKPTDSTQDHKALVDAIKAGDHKKAWQIHTSHRQKGKRNLLSIIEKFNIEQL